jgi:hypothetical protein
MTIPLGQCGHFSQVGPPKKSHFFVVLVHNFVWSSKTNSKAKAKIAWDTTILPLTKGGIKILNPKVQKFALLTKMLIRGSNLGPKPWRIFICHKVD